MKTLVWDILDAAQRRRALSRPSGRNNAAMDADVRAIVESVRDSGWEGLVAQATRIDGAPPRLEAVAPAAERARGSLDAETLEAIVFAARNIAHFHERTRPGDQRVEIVPGLVVRKTWRPIDRVGLYVPGGATPLFSSLLMLALPARAANVGGIVAVTPPRREGGLDPALALAAEHCGIEAIWTVGGAQAIAALAFGAGDIAAVDKICGPGNAWVALAKAIVSGLPGGPAIDLPAGPSELMIVADDSADPALVAADLLGQAEHDAAAQVMLVTDCAAFADAVARQLDCRIDGLARKQAVRGALSNGRIIVAATIDAAIGIANAYAPEHLSLAVRDAGRRVEQVRNAGAVFAGANAAETFGDYLCGSSHVLPTDGAARAWSGIGTASFMKAITVQTLTDEAARRVARPAALLARLEGLEAHARAAEARIATVPA